MKLKQLQQLGLPHKLHVTLTCSDGQDVFHFTDADHEGDTVTETRIASKVASLITQRAITNNTFITEMRSWDLLEDYERGDGTFEDYVTDAIERSWRDCGLLDVITEHYDHKRGFSKVTAEVETTVGEVLNLNDSDVDGWNMKVQIQAGELEIE